MPNYELKLSQTILYFQTNSPGNFCLRWKKYYHEDVPCSDL